MEQREYELTLEEKKRLRDAEMFARGAHLGQKHGDRPYWTHLRDVANIIISWNLPDYDFNTLFLMCCAWLHDVIEDTAATYQDVRRLFGEEVAELVWAVTDEIGRNREERKERTYPKIFATANSTVLKLADLHSNVTRAVRDKTRPLQMYKKEWAEHYAIFKEAIAQHDLETVVGHVLEDLNKLMSQEINAEFVDGIKRTDPDDRVKRTGVEIAGSMWQAISDKPEWRIDVRKVEDKPLQSFHWEVRLLYGDTIAGIWGSPLLSAPVHLSIYTQEGLAFNIRQALQAMLKNLNVELWRQSPSNFELHAMIVETCGELLCNCRKVLL